MNKSFKTFSLIIFIILIAFVFRFKDSLFQRQEKSVFPSERAEKFSVSSGSGLPAFAQQLIIDPYNVAQGERQIFSVWAKDEQGIESIVGEVYTDRGKESFDLSLVERDEKMGRWQGEWTTKNLDLKDTYSFSLTAVSKEGKSTKMTSSFDIQ